MVQLNFQDYEFSLNTSRGWWRWKTRIDTTLQAPQVFIRDIVSPYGLLRDSIPIPGAVISAMQDSMDQLQIAFSPVQSVDPLQLFFTVDEGRGLSVDLPVTIQNTGPFGSVLTALATASNPYINLSPTEVGMLPAQGTGTLTVRVDSAYLSPGPLQDQITITGGSNAPTTIQVFTTVRPRAILAVSIPSIQVTIPYLIDTDYPITEVELTVLNNGPATSVLEWKAKKLIDCSPWLSLDPKSGVLNGSGDSETIVLQFQPPNNILLGSYTETLRVAGYSENFYIDVPITLNIGV